MAQNSSGADQAMLAPAPGAWIDPKSGFPSPPFFELIRALWIRSGGASAPTGPGGAVGLAALVAEISALSVTAANAFNAAMMAELTSEEAPAIAQAAVDTSSNAMALSLYGDDTIVEPQGQEALLALLLGDSDPGTASVTPSGPTTDLGKTATGTNQGTAYALTASITTFTTVASGTGAVLPVGVVGSTYQVFNRGANALLVYPYSTGQIEANGASNPVSIPVGGVATFLVETSSLWYVS